METRDEEKRKRLRLSVEGKKSHPDRCQSLHVFYIYIYVCCFCGLKVLTDDDWFEVKTVSRKLVLDSSFRVMHV